MKRLYLYIPIISLLFFGFAFGQMYEEHFQEKRKATFSLKKLWETEKVLKVPESVLHDPERNVLYISSINGQPLEKNGKGFLSKLTLDGKLEELRWVTGLNAPKGSAIYQGKLYVSDIDRLVVINIENGEIETSYPAQGAIFLNDVTVDKDGTIYVSDSSEKNSIIYKLSEGKLAVWIKSANISQPNGLYAERDRLLAGSFGKGALTAVNFADKNIETITTTGFGIDGLVPDDQGNYFLSDWQGHTYVLTASGDLKELLDTTEDKINAADIEYIPERKMLLIPTFFDNRVMAYQVEH